MKTIKPNSRKQNVNTLSRLIDPRTKIKKKSHFAESAIKRKGFSVEFHEETESSDEVDFE